MVDFMDAMRTDHPGDERLARHLGINYDACHLAVEFETALEALDRLVESGVRISKIHLSSALRVRPTRAAQEKLADFADQTYFHQVIAREPDGTIRRYRDLDVALKAAASVEENGSREWRIHFHIPLHSLPTPLFDNTTDHLLGVLDFLQAHPTKCGHLEMETYTWEVMPPDLKNRSVIDQLVSEYRWTLDQLHRRGFAALSDK
jgi:hypothetical protein